LNTVFVNGNTVSTPAKCRKRRHKEIPPVPSTGAPQILRCTEYNVLVCNSNEKYRMFYYNSVKCYLQILRPTELPVI